MDRGGVVFVAVYQCCMYLTPLRKALVANAWLADSLQQMWSVLLEVGAIVHIASQLYVLLVHPVVTMATGYVATLLIL